MHKMGLSSVWGRPTTPSCRSSSRLSSNLFSWRQHVWQLDAIDYDAVMLGWEAQRVIGLRLMKLAGAGPAAQAEALRMVLKKPPRWRKQG